MRKNDAGMDPAGNGNGNGNVETRRRSHLIIAEPCDVPKDEMTPVDDGHHCSRCDRVVHDLRRATAEELDLFARQGGKRCARVLPGSRASAAFRRSGRAVALGALLTASIVGCEDEAPPPAPPPEPETASTPTEIDEEAREEARNTALHEREIVGEVAYDPWDESDEPDQPDDSDESDVEDPPEGL